MSPATTEAALGESLVRGDLEKGIGEWGNDHEWTRGVTDLSLYLLRAKGAKSGKGERMKQKPLASLASLARTPFGPGNRVAQRTPRTPRLKAWRMRRLHG